MLQTITRVHMKSNYQTAEITRFYEQRSIIARIEAFFLDNIGKIATTAQIKEVAKDPVSGIIPENWHQRLSELRTHRGYTILTNRDRNFLSVGEYLMESPDKRDVAGNRIAPTSETWSRILMRAGNCCEWRDGGDICGLHDGDIDPVGGGTVRLTADHMTPHSINPNADPNDPAAWQALCGRHQVIKKNYWDSSSGKLNIEAILQATPRSGKAQAFDFLKKYFGEE